GPRLKPRRRPVLSGDRADEEAGRVIRDARTFRLDEPVEHLDLFLDVLGCVIRHELLCRTQGHAAGDELLLECRAGSVRGRYRRLNLPGKNDLPDAGRRLNVALVPAQGLDESCPFELLDRGPELLLDLSDVVVLAEPH